jgi:transitional endoplasmic reticulum ATPase
MDVPCVTAADVAAARAVVRPSLDPAQLEMLRNFAAQREQADAGTTV